MSAAKMISVDKLGRAVGAILTGRAQVHQRSVTAVRQRATYSNVPAQPPATTANATQVAATRVKHQAPPLVRETKRLAVSFDYVHQGSAMHSGYS